MFVTAVGLVKNNNTMNI